MTNDALHFDARLLKSKGLLTDKSDAIGSCNLKPNDNDNENDDNLSSN